MAAFRSDLSLFLKAGGDLTFERESRYGFLSYRTGGGRECYVKRTNDDEGEEGVGVGA